MKPGKSNYAQTDDILSAQAACALAGSLVAGLLFWIGVAALIV